MMQGAADHLINGTPEGTPTAPEGIQRRPKMHQKHTKEYPIKQRGHLRAHQVPRNRAALAPAFVCWYTEQSSSLRVDCTRWADGPSGGVADVPKRCQLRDLEAGHQPPDVHTWQQRDTRLARMLFGHAIAEDYRYRKGQRVFSRGIPN